MPDNILERMSPVGLHTSNIIYIIGIICHPWPVLQNALSSGERRLKSLAEAQSARLYLARTQTLRNTDIGVRNLFKFGATRGPLARRRTTQSTASASRGTLARETSPRT